MRILQNCQKPGCEGHVIPIYHRKKEGSRVRRVAFYLCKTCSRLQKFLDMPYDNFQFFPAYIVPNENVKSLLLMEKDKVSKIHCLYCTLSETIGKELVKEENHKNGTTHHYKEIVIPAITKVYTINPKPKRLRFAGYICEPCRAVYFRRDIAGVKWNTHKVKVDVLFPIRETLVRRIRMNGLEQEEKEKKAKREKMRIKVIKKWKSKEQKVREKHRKIMSFESIGTFMTLSGV